MYPATETASTGAAQKEVPPPPPESAPEQRASRDCNLKELHGQLKKLLDSKPASRTKIEMGTCRPRDSSVCLYIRLMLAGACGMNEEER